MESRSGASDNLNFTLLRSYFQAQFLKYFESIKGDKSVYFDDGLLKQMTFVMGGKPAGIVDIIQLNSREAIAPNSEKVIFVVRPDLEVIRSVIFQKQCFKTEKEIYILYVPRRTIECDEELEKAGVNTTN